MAAVTTFDVVGLARSLIDIDSTTGSEGAVAQWLSGSTTDPDAGGVAFSDVEFQVDPDLDIEQHVPGSLRDGLRLHGRVCDAQLLQIRVES